MILERLTTMLYNSGIKEYAIIVDGSYLMHSKKMVYTSLTDYDSSDVSITFYVKNDKSDDLESTRTPVLGIANQIETMLRNGSIGTVNTGFTSSLEKASIRLDNNNRLVILESELYHTVKGLMIENLSTSTSFMFGGEIVTRPLRNSLCEEFKRVSYEQYANVVYSIHSSRILHKLMRRNKFYGIQKSFIPVFIDCSFLYNPLKYEKNIQKTKLYCTAEKMGRRVDVDGISCYFLTHLEICRALGMENFVRFTPDFLFKLIVGQLYPNYKSFPNLLNKMMLRFGNGDSTLIKNNTFTVDKHIELFSYYTKQLESSKNEEKTTELLRKLDELKQFEEVDSLYTAIAESHSRLTNIGASALDDKKNISVATLYNYFSKARLLFEEDL